MTRKPRVSKLDPRPENHFDHSYSNFSGLRFAEPAQLFKYIFTLIIKLSELGAQRPKPQLEHPSSYLLRHPRLLFYANLQGNRAEIQH